AACTQGGTGAIDGPLGGGSLSTPAGAPPRGAVRHHAVPTSRTRRRRLRAQPHGKQSRCCLGSGLFAETTFGGCYLLDPWSLPLAPSFLPRPALTYVEGRFQRLLA